MKLPEFYVEDQNEELDSIESSIKEAREELNTWLARIEKTLDFMHKRATWLSNDCHRIACYSLEYIRYAGLEEEKIVELNNLRKRALKLFGDANKVVNLTFDLYNKIK
jgi:hypothetical protein